jgi:hypothetical protein
MIGKRCEREGQGWVHLPIELEIVATEACAAIIHKQVGEQAGLTSTTQQFRTGIDIESGMVRGERVNLAGVL